MTELTAFCPNCHQKCQFDWLYDYDSDAQEPNFTVICLTCGLVTDASKLELGEEA